MPPPVLGTAGANGSDEDTLALEPGICNAALAVGPVRRLRLDTGARNASPATGPTTESGAIDRGW